MNPDRKLVLLIDDEENFLDIARMLLEAQDDLVVVTARDGRSALRLLDVLEPDVIVTDIMMPICDGFEFLREYQQRPSPAPVVASSAVAPYLDLALERGAIAALRKPFDATVLVETVRKAIVSERTLATPAPFVEAEQRRLRAILELQLEQPAPEPELQAYIEQVGEYFEAPIALFSVVTADRQFWTAGCGIPPDLSEVRGTPRQHSFCTHAVVARAALVVQDALDNPLFRGNILVESRGFRFYAGVPLIARHGEALGTLCVLDFQPRTFTHGDLELLSLFGRRVLAAIEWRERKMSPGIPQGAFRYLDYIDRELDIFGAIAFRDLAVVEAIRSCESETTLSCAVIAVPARRLREVTRKLAARHPRSLLGRLGHSRLGWLVPGVEAKELEAATLEVVGGHAFVGVVSLSEHLGAVPAVLSQIEQELGDAGLA